jgi:glycosyltransferase involved in cell wall biosynthesis
MAEKMDFLAEDEDQAQRLGENAYNFISQITWEKTIQKLVIV